MQAYVLVRIEKDTGESEILHLAPKRAEVENIRQEYLREGGEPENVKYIISARKRLTKLLVSEIVAHDVVNLEVSG
jgi:hypothetical protein